MSVQQQGVDRNSKTDDQEIFEEQFTRDYSGLALLSM